MRLLCTIQNTLSLITLAMMSCILTYTMIAILRLIDHTVPKCGLLTFNLLQGLLISKGVSWVPRLLALGLWGFVCPSTGLR